MKQELLFLCTFIESEALFFNSSMQVDGACVVLSSDRNLSFIVWRRVTTMSAVYCTSASTCHGTGSEGQQILIQASSTWWRNSCFHLNACRARRSSHQLNTHWANIVYSWWKHEHMFNVPYFETASRCNICIRVHVSQDINIKHQHVMFFSYCRFWIAPLNLSKTIFFKWVTVIPIILFWTHL